MTKTPPKAAVLLMNTGSPDAPDAPSLRKYLAQFLSDGRIIEMSAWKWQPILRCFILPFRPKASAERYKLVWSSETGSPLIHYTKMIARKMNFEFEKTNSGVKVFYAMRYGSPSVESVMKKIEQEGIDRIVVLPMFAQYAPQTSAACADAVFDYLKGSRRVPSLRFVRDYHLDPGYIKAVAEGVERYWEENGSNIERGGKLIISFHGVPEEGVAKGDDYKNRCIETARAVADSLGLDSDSWKCAFQSRFGRAEWIKPYTLDEACGMAARGESMVDVVCPGFAVDCLETIEEIGDEMKRAFSRSLPPGVEGEFRYIPCLNDSEGAVDFYLNLVKRELQGWT